MNSSSGGSHILLFERDQQLAALLTNEFQLVGLECHTARTAVEVFDTIARYPVRLVLVNLAQAAASRREFWVALDTQRRGRGVQVFTFHCTNIAGYGPAVTEDTDEPSQAMLADMDVDGMIGLMNMVNTIRSRITASNTGSLARISSNGNTQVTSESSMASTATMPFPTATSNLRVGGSRYENGKNGTNFMNVPVSQSMQPNMRIPSPAPAPSQPETPRMPTHTPTDKIRSVIYPNQRAWTTPRDNNGSNAQLPTYREPPMPVDGASSSRNGTPASTPIPLPAELSRDSRDERENGSGEMTFPNESGLAQLSRMLQERDASPNSGSPLLEELARGQYGNERPSHEQRETYMPNNTNGQRTHPAVEPTPLSAIGLRASPIQDLPTERTDGGQSERELPSYPNPTVQRNEEPPLRSSSVQASSSTLVSINTPSSHALLTVPPTPKVTQLSSPVLPSEEGTLVHPETNTSHAPETTRGTTAAVLPTEPAQKKDSSHGNEGNLMEQIQAMVVSEAARSAAAETPRAGTDNALLLDIVQSLPPMPSPPPQQALNGRATRSLGSVLLEGHLVPQDRLEVAQNIQRMLRSVDMNYQLGEILLMFKLLTPDQLLAASLVSFGMISAVQIRSLGRIRQELYSIGLEYDLENLLILFRILTSEQLREVRTSWSG
jgi:hypothetical protein